MTARKKPKADVRVYPTEKEARAAVAGFVAPLLKHTAVKAAVTREYRIETRKVWVVLQARPPKKDGGPRLRDWLDSLVHLWGHSWTPNGEEVAICDSLESAQEEVKRRAEHFEKGES